MGRITRRGFVAGTAGALSGLITAGGAVLLLRRSLDETPAPPPGSLHNLTPAATAPFNRPPRPGQTPAGEPLVPPSRNFPPL